MALTPEEARQKAYDSSVAAGEEKVAIMLKKQFGNLAYFAYPELEIPKEDEEYRKMARELIDNRQMHARTKDGSVKRITIDDLDAKMDELSQGDPNSETNVKSAFGVKSLGELIPTRDQLDSTGKAIAQGVYDNTGSIGFLGGATVMNALSGLFQWIKTGFSGGFEGLKKAIANVSAENMQSSVSDNLRKLRESDPKMRPFLNDEAIQGIGDTVRSTVLAEAGFTPPADPNAPPSKPAETLESVTPGSMADTKLSGLHTQIYEGILKGSGDKTLGAMIGDVLIEKKTKKGWFQDHFGFVKGASDADLRAKGDVIAKDAANAVANAVTDPTFRTKNGKKLAEVTDKDEFIDSVVDEAVRKVQERENAYKLPEGSLSENIDELKKFARTELSKDEYYKKLSMASRLAAKVSDDRARELAAGERDASPEGVGRDAGFNQSNGSLVGSAGQSPRDANRTTGSPTPGG